MPRLHHNDMSAWDILTAIADMASAGRTMIKGRHPGIEYWLKQAEDEAYRAMQGQATPASALPKLVAACPSRGFFSADRLRHIENKLAELRAVATAQGLGNLAMSIEAARIEAKKKDLKGRS